MGMRREYKPRGISLKKARERNLKALGKSGDWYDAKFLEQHGSCAVCHEPETRIGLDGKPRPLVVNVAGDCLLCRKCSARQNKQNQRQRDSDYKKLVATKAQGPQTVTEWWRKNRNGFSEAEKIAHEYRDGEIINFLCSINAWLGEENVDDEDGRECLRESIREFCDEVSQHGVVDTGYITPDEEKKPQGVADGLYFRFGYFAAIPADVASSFIEFSERALGIDPHPYDAYGGYSYREKRIARILATLNGQTYIDPDLVVRCATPQCGATTTWKLHEIPPAQWFCDACTAARQRAGQAFLSGVRNKQLEEMQNANQPRQLWMKPREADDTVFGEEGVYRG